tara:strand:- start:4921 stop:5400 length:480 start_codon:yes stop_codon:yes gene_type:complete
MNFKVRVNSDSEFDISPQDLSLLDAIKTSETTYHVLYDNNSYMAEITSSNFNQKSYNVKINNTTYKVAIFNDLDVLIKEMGFALSSAKHVDFIKAPMPGLILDISIIVGQSVKEDDPLLILEAMKMENILTSPREGVIKSISVKKGDAVDKNTLLIEFE